MSVSNITVGSLSPTSLRLRWLPPNPDEWNGIISRYTIEYSLLRQVQDDDDDDENMPSIDLRMNFVAYSPSSRQGLLNNPDPRLVVTPLVWEELEINGLQQHFVYSLSVYYENSAGRSENSDAVELNMPPAGTYCMHDEFYRSHAGTLIPLAISRYHPNEVRLYVDLRVVLVIYISLLPSGACL